MGAACTRDRCVSAAADANLEELQKDEAVPDINSFPISAASSPSLSSFGDGGAAGMPKLQLQEKLDIPGNAASPRAEVATPPPLNMKKLNCNGDADQAGNFLRALSTPQDRCENEVETFRRTSSTPHARSEIEVGAQGEGDWDSASDSSGDDLVSGMAGPTCPSVLSALNIGDKPAAPAAVGLAGAAQVGGATGSAAAPKKDPRMYLSAPTPDALERFQKTGQKVTSVVRLSKILRAPLTLDVPPVKCAISLDKLNEFNKSAINTLGAEYKTATMRSVISAIIQPQCDAFGKAYARAVNDDMPCTGQVFVCHCWDELLSEFMESVNHVFRDWSRRPNLWISAFALVQSRRRTPFTRPMDAPFAAALKASQAILVVRSKQVDIASRIWPLWEMYLSHKFGFLEKEGGLLLAGTDPFCNRQAVDSLKAEASNRDDKAAINEAILEQGGYAEINKVAAGILAPQS